MKLSITPPQLRLIAKFVAGLPPKQPSQPIVAGVLLRVEGGHLVVEATDLCVSLRLKIPCAGREGGCVLNPRMISALAATHQTANLLLDQTTLIWDAGEARGTVEVQTADRWPELPTIEEPTFTAELPTETLSAWIERLSWAMYRGGDRANLSGLHLVGDGVGRVKAWAANGHVYGWSHAAVDHDAAFSVMIPSAVAPRLADALKVTPDTIAMAGQFSDGTWNNVGFRFLVPTDESAVFGELYCLSAELGMRDPDFGKIDSSLIATFDRGELSRELTTALSMIAPNHTDFGTNSFTTWMRPEEGRIALSAVGMARGSKADAHFSSSVGVSSAPGWADVGVGLGTRPSEMGASTSYLLGALKGFPMPRLGLFINAHKWIQFSAVDGEGRPLDFLHFVIAQRTN